MKRARAGAAAVVLLAALALVLLLRAPPRAVEPSRPEPVASALEPALFAPEPEPSQPSARANRSTIPSAKREASDNSPFADEDDYLRALERLNVSDKPRALELVQKGEGWYPAAGEKAQARRALGITLLVDLGNMAEARARTERFITEYPDSRYRPLVQGVTGIHPRPTGPTP